MCEPLTIASLVATAAGTGLSLAGQAKAQSATNDAISAEQARQQALDSQSNASFQDILGQMGASDQKQLLDQSAAERVTNFQNALAGDPSQPAGAASLNAGAPKVIQGEVGKALSKAGRRSSGIQARGAKLGGEGDVSSFRNILFGDLSRRLGTTAGFKAGSSGVLPLELQDARSKGGTLRGFGDILNAVGMVSGLGAIAGAPSGAANAARAKAIAARGGAAARAGQASAMPGIGARLFQSGRGIRPVIPIT